MLTDAGYPGLWDAAFGSRPGLAPLPAAADPAQQWLRAVCLGGQGRYAAAWTELATAATAPCPAPLASQLVSTRASLLRQLGRHRRAAALDGTALSLVAGLPGGQGRLARCDALTGLAADALGRRRLELASSLLERCRHELPGARQGTEWRAHVRWHWVAAELALAGNVPAVAGRHAKAALAQAMAHPSERHRIKSELLCAAVAAASGDHRQARQGASEVAWKCREHDLLPLRWAAAMLRSSLDQNSPAATEVLVCAAELARRGGRLNLSGH